MLQGFNTKTPEARENLFNAITDIILSSEEINETKLRVVNELGKAFNCDRCVLRIFNKDTEAFYPMDSYSEYRKSPDVKSFSEVKYSETFNNFVNQSYSNGTCFFISDIDQFEKEFGKNDISGALKYGLDVKSNYCCPVSTDNKLVGALILHYTKEKTALCPKELDLLKTIARQLLLAVNKHEIEKQKELNLKKAETLRKFSEMNLYSANLDVTIQKNAELLGEFFDAECVVIGAASIKTKKFILDGDMPVVKDFENPALKAFWSKRFSNEPDIVFIEDIESSNFPDHIKKEYCYLGVKSIIAKNISRDENYTGGIVIESFRNLKPLNESHRELLRTVSNYIYLVMEKHNLSIAREKTIEREQLLRRLTNIIRSILDINQLKDTIVKVIGEYLKADRVFVMEYDQHTGYFTNTDSISEYLSSREVKSISGIETKYESLKYFQNIDVVKQPIIFSNLDDYLKKNKITGEAIEDYYKDCQVRSNIGLPIIYRENIYGRLILHYTQSFVKFTKDELDFIKALTDQIGVAFHQAHLLEKTKKQAEIETLSRNTVSAINKTLEVDEILETICSESNKLFDVQRTTLIEFLDGKSWRVRKEQRIGKTIANLKDIKHDPRTAEFFNKSTLDEQVFLIDDVNSKDIPDYVKKDLLSVGIKSIIVSGIGSEGKQWGNIIIADYEKCRVWNEFEVNLIKNISDQLYNAIKHSDLYEKTKQKAEQERISRSVIEAVRSTLDLSQLKQNIVTEIGKVMGAGRCALNQVNPDTNKFYVIDEFSEYRSSTKLTSFVGIDLEKDLHFDFFKRKFLEKSMMIKDWEYYIESVDETLLSRETKQLIKKFDIHSNYIFRITHLDKLYGVLYLNYTGQKKYLSKDDIEFMDLLMIRLGNALYQATLYDKLSKNNKREKFLSKVISAVKSSLDLKEILSVIFTDIRDFYGLKNVIYDSKLLNSFKHLFDIEIDKFDISTAVCSECQVIKDLKLNGSEIEVIDLTDSEKCLENIKQLVLIPIKIQDLKLGNIYLLLDKPKYWEVEDINLIGKVADNISIAMRDSGLYTKSKFMSDVSHELRTPVAIIDGYIQNLANKEEYNPKTVAKYLGVIKNNSLRIKNIIENLSLISKLEESIDENYINIDEISLINLIKTAFDCFKGEARLRDIKFEIDCPGDLKIRANEVLMEQVFINLISNAVKYSSDNSKIIVKCYQSTDNTSISIKDFGCGIEEKHLKNIFKRFYRVDKSRSRETGGSGLGLSIVEQIIDIHGGEVKVESELEKGTQFTISIPVRN